MVIQKLSENLRLQFTVTPYIPDPAQEVFTFKPLRVPGALKTGILYGAAPEDLSGREFPAGICIAVAGDPASAESAFAVQNHPDVNFLFISGLTLPDLMSVISDVFMEETRFTTQINRLSVVSSSNAGLQPLIDQAHSVLECPIVVMDSSYRVLAISLGSLAEDHQELSRQQEIGIITERNLKRMKRDRVYEKLRQAPNHILYTKARDSDIWWVNMLITVHGIEVAEAGIQETHRKFSDYDFQYIRFLQQMIALEFQRSNYFETDFGIAHSIFVKELLDHQFISEEMIAQRAHLLGWKSAPYYFIMSVYPDEQAVHPSQKKMEIFVHRILSVLPNCRWRINDENLVLLIPRQDSSFRFFRELGALHELLRFNHLLAILSNPFTRLMDVQKGYDQTQAVHRLRSVIKEERRLWIYTDYVILHMADLLRGSNSLSDFCHPYILQIFRYDQENDTSYLKTLREYLTNINNPALCARNLHIHKNTLYYRINKICDMFDLDLNNGSLRMRLQLSLELLQMS